MCARECVCVFRPPEPPGEPRRRERGSARGGRRRGGAASRGRGRACSDGGRARKISFSQSPPLAAPHTPSVPSLPLASSEALGWGVAFSGFSEKKKKWSPRRRRRREGGGGDGPASLLTCATRRLLPFRRSRERGEAGAAAQARPAGREALRRTRPRPGRARCSLGWAVRRPPARPVPAGGPGDGAPWPGSAFVFW